jgi:hypothetical protein
MVFPFLVSNLGKSLANCLTGLMCFILHFVC